MNVLLGLQPYKFLADCGRKGQIEGSLESVISINIIGLENRMIFQGLCMVLVVP
jgi:hypothetical protein